MVHLVLFLFQQSSLSLLKAENRQPSRLIPYVLITFIASRIRNRASHCRNLVQPLHEPFRHPTIWQPVP